MILSMKKALIVTMKEDRAPLLEALQTFGAFMPEGTNTGGEKLHRAKDALARTRSVYDRSAPYRKAKGMLTPRTDGDAAELLRGDREGEGLLTRLEEQLTKLDKAQEKADSLRARLNGLAPWRELEVPAESLRNNSYTSYITGFARESVLPRLVEALGDSVVICQVGSRGDRAALVCVCAREDMTDSTAALRAGGFEPENVPLQQGLVADVIRETEQAVADADGEVDAVRETLRELSAGSASLERLLESQLAAADREGVAVSETNRTCFVTGWVPERDADRLLETVQAVSPDSAVLLEDPAEGEEPPTLADNNALVRPFETITDMFARPAYGGLDPNPVMGLWYWLIFGMMMADAGYGLLLFLGAFAYLKLGHPRGETEKLVRVLLFGSASTVIFGVLFGSYFGETFHPLMFSPMESPMSMLIFSLAVGVLHLFTGMALDMIQKARAGHFWDGIFDDLSWMLLILGIGGMLLPAFKRVGTVLAVTGAAVILFTAGREKKGIIGKAVGGLGGLYNITGFLSDILSYSRILALGMATGVIGMVMNLLAGLVRGGGGVPGWIFALLIYAVGHLFNLVMGLLSAYVHDSRLQYIEFFGKFYSGGGCEFKPLTFENQYVDVKR